MKAGWPDKATSSIGRSCRFSITTNATSSAPPPTNDPRISPLPQPGVTAQHPETIRNSAAEKHDEPGDVRATGVEVTGFRRPSEREIQRDDPDRDVDEEHPAPPDRIGDHAAD